MPTARIHDIDLVYEEHGEGPPLLAIMGLTGSRYHWRGFPERFAEKHRVITYDNRGVGETSAPMGPYTAAQMADDAIGLLDHLGIEKAIVFGVSMGGMIAQEVALRAPGRVGKLILGCTHFGGVSAIPPHQRVTEAFSTIGQGGVEESIRRLLRTNFSERFLAERGDLFEEMLKHGVANRMSPKGFQGQFMAVATHDTAARVNGIGVETLIITGDDDLLIPHGNAALLAKQVPNNRVAILPGVGHMFWIEGAPEAEAAIRAFID